MPPTVSISSNQHGHTVCCASCGVVYRNASTKTAALNIRRSHLHREHDHREVTA